MPHGTGCTVFGFDALPLLEVPGQGTIDVSAQWVVDAGKVLVHLMSAAVKRLVPSAPVNLARAHDKEQS